MPTNAPDTTGPAERRVMRHKDDKHLHFLDDGDCKGWGCYGCDVADPTDPAVIAFLSVNGGKG